MRKNYNLLSVVFAVTISCVIPSGESQWHRSRLGPVKNHFVAHGQPSVPTVLSSGSSGHSGTGLLAQGGGRLGSSSGRPSAGSGGQGFSSGMTGWSADSPGSVGGTGNGGFTADQGHSEKSASEGKSGQNFSGPSDAPPPRLSGPRRPFVPQQHPGRSRFERGVMSSAPPSSFLASGLGRLSSVAWGPDASAHRPMWTSSWPYAVNSASPAAVRALLPAVEGTGNDKFDIFIRQFRQRAQPGDWANPDLELQRHLLCSLKGAYVDAMGQPWIEEETQISAPVPDEHVQEINTLRHHHAQEGHGGIQRMTRVHGHSVTTQQAL